MSSPLLARLAELRKASKEANQSSRCESEEALLPTSLATFLILYSKSHHDSYINYMEGAKALIAWCFPIDLSAADSIELPVKYDWIVHSYDTNTLADHLTGTTYGVRHCKVQALICQTLRRLIKEGKI